MIFAFLGNIPGLVAAAVETEAPERYLNSCAAAGVCLLSVYETAEGLRFLVRASQLKKAEAAAQVCRGTFSVLKRKGASRWLGFMRRRAIPMLLALCLVSALFMSGFCVWDIEVSGNEATETGVILDALADCGVRSGAFWPAFSADGIRSELLLRLPSLRWATVNMRGSAAEVIVVEREDTPRLISEISGNIIARRSGFVQRVEALQGDAAVQRGDAVNAGDILIVSKGNETALGYVEAETFTQIMAIRPQMMQSKSYTGKEKSRYAIIIGDKRINFYSDSSISPPLCDKINSVWKFEIEGLFSLPVKIVEEKLIFYELESRSADKLSLETELTQLLESVLEQEMDSGEILSSDLCFSHSGELSTATLRARSIENIASRQE